MKRTSYSWLTFEEFQDQTTGGQNDGSGTQFASDLKESVLSRNEPSPIYHMALTEYPRVLSEVEPWILQQNVPNHN